MAFATTFFFLGGCFDVDGAAIAAAALTAALIVGGAVGVGLGGIFLLVVVVAVSMNKCDVDSLLYYRIVP